MIPEEQPTGREAVLARVNRAARDLGIEEEIGLEEAQSIIDRARQIDDGIPHDSWDCLRVALAEWSGLIEIIDLQNPTKAVLRGTYSPEEIEEIMQRSGGNWSEFLAGIAALSRKRKPEEIQETMTRSGGRFSEFLAGIAAFSRKRKPEDPPGND